MQITLDAKTLEKPENMPLKAELAWRYFNINDTCGWIAVEAGCIGVLLTDESGDLDCSSYIFATVNEFVQWLSDVADEHLEDEPREFLITTGMIHQSVATEAAVNAVLQAIRQHTDH